MGLDALNAANAAETLAYLARRPYENVYVAWLIATGYALRGGEVALWRASDGDLTGACYLGRQIVPCTDAPEAIEHFAERARRTRASGSLVGPRADVERFWHFAKRWMPAPSIRRASQPVYALERAHLRYTRDDADVARATVAEVDELVPQSAAMIAGESGSDPRRYNADFRGRTQRIVEAGWWWRYRVDGQLAFMCNVGSATPHTAQVQGVWSPPNMRGHGYAARALGAICDHLLDEHPTLCLYVNDFNAPAVALYERVGFQQVGEFATLFF